MDGYSKIRQFISPFLQGKNIDGILFAFGKVYELLQQTSIAVTDQLTISTASAKYLDLRLADKGLVRPPEIGLSDEAFRKIGITITAQKQISELIHLLIEVFYGPDATRGLTISDLPEPYVLDGADLTLKIDNNDPVTIVFNSQNLNNVNNASAQDVVNTLNVFFQNFNLNAQASVFLDPVTKLKYVKLYGGAKGPTSMVQILGGRAQLEFQFPVMRDTELPSNNTTWQITKYQDNIIRFRWESGAKPKLENIRIGDKILLYGPMFEAANAKLIGTFTVLNVRPPQAAPAPDAGWFEFNANITELTNTQPDVLPPPNTPTITYSYSVTQLIDNDLRFFLAKENKAFLKQRFALAFENNPAKPNLKIFLPVTPALIERQLIGGAHLSFKHPDTDFDGIYGHATDPDKQIEIINEYTIRFPDLKTNNIAEGGTLTYGMTTKNILRIYREEGYTYVTTLTPHGLIGTNQWQSTVNYLTNSIVYYEGYLYQALQNSGPGFGGAKIPELYPSFWKILSVGVNRTNTLVTIQADKIVADESYILGPFIWDRTAKYTFGKEEGTLRFRISKEKQYNFLAVGAEFPKNGGYLLLEAGTDREEGPIPYYFANYQTANNIINIQTISQVGTTAVTVLLAEPHYAIPGSAITITGTTNFNGTWTVAEVPADNVLVFHKPLPGTAFETTGQLTVILDKTLSFLKIDSYYFFKHNHDLTSRVSFITHPEGYVPLITGKDYSLYITDVARVREFCITLIKDVIAAGILVNIILIYPDDTGLGHDIFTTDLQKDGPWSEAATYVWAI